MDNDTLAGALVVRTLSTPNVPVFMIRLDEWLYRLTRHVEGNIDTEQVFTQNHTPKMHDEFLLQYQLPIMKEFGLVAYGCCEDLTQKIDMLRQIPNLRRIAVAPRADIRKCSEQIGNDYVMSWRPNPTDMVAYQFDEDLIRRIIGNGLEACRESTVHVHLKDVETVGGDPGRLKRWVQLVRETAEHVLG